jgi:small subunit ribosomal protein S3
MAMERHFIQEGLIRSEIETFLRRELEGAGYSGINIQKTPLATRVVLYVEKPPLVIGKKGRRINKLTRFLKEKYGIDNPAIDVQTVENPNLDANIVARRIAQALEKGMNRRRVVYKAVRSAMGSGARGIEVIVAGKIIGKGGRAKQEKYLQGYMRKVGDSAKLVRTGSTQSFMKAGVIGITVKIVPPDIVFPDQIELKIAKKEQEKPSETAVPTALEAKKEETAPDTKAAEAKPAEKPKAKADKPIIPIDKKIAKKIGAEELLVEPEEPEEPEADPDTEKA